MTVHLITGDCRDVLPTLPAQSVQCVVTSPPYFNLRDYGTAAWEGGDGACDHKGPPMRTNAKATVPTHERGPTTFHGGTNRADEFYSAACGKCGAVRNDRQIGLESTLVEYIAEMVAVFRLVRNVLRDDGTVWLNLGSSYGPDKCDLMVPSRVALALIDDGWILRSPIIWAKKAPMPESVTDRPTSAHEHIFLLTKRARYFYDQDAVREPHVSSADKYEVEGKRYREQGKHRAVQHAGTESRFSGGQHPSGRNQRNVWHLGPEAFAEAHFATFPTEIPRRCILAGTREGDTVLDPFSGAGTTLLVADRLGRHGIGIELSEEYSAMARKRITNDAPMFAEVLA